jgi:hypothetical protein
MLFISVTFVSAEWIGIKNQYKRDSDMFLSICYNTTQALRKQAPRDHVLV